MDKISQVNAAALKGDIDTVIRVGVPVAHKILARRYFSIESDEVRAAIATGLWKAMGTFVPERGRFFYWAMCTSIPNEVRDRRLMAPMVPIQLPVHWTRSRALKVQAGTIKAAMPIPVFVSGDEAVQIADAQWDVAGQEARSAALYLAVQDALQTAPERYRDVLERCALEGTPVSAHAAQLGVCRQAVWQVWARFLKRVRAAYCAKLDACP